MVQIVSMPRVLQIGEGVAHPRVVPEALGPVVAAGEDMGGERLHRRKNEQAVATDVDQHRDEMTLPSASQRPTGRAR